MENETSSMSCLNIEDTVNTVSKQHAFMKQHGRSTLTW